MRSSLPSRRSRETGASLVLIIVVLALVGGAAYWWFYARGGTTGSDLQFRTAAISRGAVTQTITATGELQPVIEVEVSSQISGLVTEVLVDFNDIVKAGDVLARIDPATYQSRLESAQAEFTNSEANHRLASLNNDRVVSLFERKLVSRQELDQAQATLAQANAQLLIRRAAVANAETDLARCTLYAPIDGIVIDRLAEVGKTVAASLNAPTLFTLINDLSEMEINAFVSEADISLVAEGQPVEFTVDAFPNRTFRGLVRQIRNSPQSEQSVVVYSTIIKVDNRELKLKPGMTANVSIVIASRPNVLRVPNSALRVRIPDTITINERPDTAALADATVTAEPADPREQFRALMKEAGWDGEGRPDRGIMVKARALAEQRGVEIPQRGGGGGDGAGGNNARPQRQAPADNRPTVRTLYRVVSTDPTPVLESVKVRLGITDGSTTELLDGLNEGDEIITGLMIVAAGDDTAANNPFAAPSRGPRR
ncbi:efflux RND transporter periplasmic adaptor subunit [Synoicihabitans lomoniglobus]|uniref:Efflux RND transporter periplasmic adaptor subunit n=1 Tax=Synoicihabitans lomoniglobus TaxID=2909285 RepID=A0AAF0I729_9BACT|nr:efflux RND transporter periplasmic adaptor subunit [Opitutaceae bacterium LMO-M01]WED66451.1 efflux RND transporter periplasmic adaptor subunit [Opitutaceae bacterium LMO-M01]